MKTPTLALMVLAIPSMLTAQPYSTSMADCAALHQNAAQWVKTDESAQRLMQRARAWHSASIAQAQAEGIRDADTVMVRMMDDKTAAWEARGAVFFFSEEYRDWTSYCRSFARHLGLQMPS